MPRQNSRWTFTLQFKQALADYTRCEQADGVSVESRYRVGMAQYMLQNYDAATAAFAGSLAIVPQDDDMYIADVYWLVLSQLRAGKADAAQKTLRQHYRPDMYVGHHTAYEKAMRAAAGYASMDILAELDAEPDDLQYAMTAYGLCVLLQAHDEKEKADALREKLLKRDGFWFCFSYLAAYHDQAKNRDWLLFDYYCLRSFKSWFTLCFQWFSRNSEKTGVVGKNRTTLENTAFYQDTPENSDSVGRTFESCRAYQKFRKII